MTTKTTSALAEALALLERLDSENVRYDLLRVRDALMVSLSVPGERWEIEFFDDGSIEVERFRSTGTIEGREALDRLLAPDGPLLGPAI